MTRRLNSVTQNGARNGLWAGAIKFIESVKDANALLSYAKSLEEKKDRFFQLKVRAIGKAVAIVKNSNGKSSGIARSFTRMANESGYTTTQLKQYSQLYELVRSADKKSRDLLDKDQYWLDALRRKPSEAYIRHAIRVITHANQENISISPSQVRDQWDNKHKAFSEIIKPTDNWNFTRVVYSPTIGGSIPGEIYANAFWYFVKPGDVVIDPMAGGGMAKTVYDDRSRWQGKKKYDFDLKMFDLNPLNRAIRSNDLLEDLPVRKADYIFIDPPYWGMSNGFYSKDPRDMANFALPEFIKALSKIAMHCAKVQRTGMLCTVLMSNYTDVKNGRVVLLIELVRSAWQEAGYRLFHVAYAARHIQQTQTTGMANLNNIAKEKRTPLTDMVEVLTFRKT